MRGWLKAVFALSLAANIGVAGLAAGVFWRHGAPHSDNSRRDLGLGPLAWALTPDQRKAYRDGLLEQFPDLKQGRETLRGDFDALQAALAKDPFDPNMVDAAIALAFKRTTDRLDVSQTLLAGLIKDMSPQERADFWQKLNDVFTSSGAKSRLEKSKPQ